MVFIASLVTQHSRTAVDVIINTQGSLSNKHQAPFACADVSASGTLTYASRKKVFMLLGSTIALKPFPFTSNVPTRLTLCVLSVR